MTDFEIGEEAYDREMSTCPLLCKNYFKCVVDVSISEVD